MLLVCNQASGCVPGSYLWEMPSIPLPYPHAPTIDSLIKGIKRGYLLNNVVVVLVDIELDLAPRVSMTHAELCAPDIAILQTLQQLLRVMPKTAQKICHNLRSVARLAHHAREFVANRPCQLLVCHAQNNLALLPAGLRQVEFQNLAEVVGQDALGNLVNILKALGVIPVVPQSARNVTQWTVALYLHGEKFTSLTILPNFERSYIEVSETA